MTDLPTPDLSGFMGRPVDQVARWNRVLTNWAQSSEDVTYALGTTFTPGPQGMLPGFLVIVTIPSPIPGQPMAAGVPISDITLDAEQIVMAMNDVLSQMYAQRSQVLAQQGIQASGLVQQNGHDLLRG